MKHSSGDTASNVKRFVGTDRGWVTVQTLLEAASILGGPVEVLVRGRGFSLVSNVVSVIVGGIILLGAIVVLLKSKKDLGDNLTTSPTPVEDGHFVDQGIYGTVRHPMYLGVMLAMFGWAVLLGSLVSLAVAILIVPFLLAKIRREERLLLARYPAYARYRDRVRHRFIPRVL